MLCAKHSFSDRYSGIHWYGHKDYEELEEVPTQGLKHHEADEQDALLSLCLSVHSHITLCRALSQLDNLKFGIALLLNDCKSPPPYS